MAICGMVFAFIRLQGNMDKAAEVQSRMFPKEFLIGRFIMKKMLSLVGAALIQASGLVADEAKAPAAATVAPAAATTPVTKKVKHTKKRAKHAKKKAAEGTYSTTAPADKK